MEVLFQTPPVRAVSGLQRRRDGSEWPGTARLVVTLYEPSDPNPMGPGGYPVAKPLSHWRDKSSILRTMTVPLFSPSIKSADLIPVPLPPNLFNGLPDSTLIAFVWQFRAD